MNGTVAIDGRPTPAWQIAGTVGVAVTVGVIVGVRVIVGVSVMVAVDVTVPVAAGVDVGSDAQPLAVHASQQLGNPVVQVAPPLGARHFAGLDLTEHLVRPLAVVRQQVTQPAGRPHVDRVTHFVTSPLHELGTPTAVPITPLAQRTYAARSVAAAHGHVASI